MTYSNSNGFTQTGSSVSGDRPASSTFYVSSNTGFRATNETATLTFANVTGLASYVNKQVTLRLAAFSIGSTSNGLDVGDNVVVEISLNNGTTYSSELQVNGNSNAYWHYTTGTGEASVTYDGNNTPSVFAPAGGGSRTSDGYSTMTIDLPNAATQVRIRITMVNSSTNEAWLIDDVKVTGCTVFTPTIAVTETSGTPNDGTICNGVTATLDAGSYSSYSWAPGGATTQTINVTPATTTTYTVTVTDANGCTGTGTKVITVNNLPSAGTTVSETSGSNNDGNICTSGASVTITATGGGTYAWSTGPTTAAITVNPTTTTTYTVTVTNANGCTATASRTITLIPTAGLTAAETSGLAHAYFICTPAIRPRVSSCCN